mmetsp:Transcript_1887/g.3946  ORF Transcript_1887/g.3946 Transcript_1887/m.3946 type:complete len:82 (+) Transcript_1887:27-272(+)
MVGTAVSGATGLRVGQEVVMVAAIRGATGDGILKRSVGAPVFSLSSVPMKPMGAISRKITVGELVSGSPITFESPSVDEDG